MKRTLLGATLAILLLVPMLGLAQVSQVHLGWSTNDVYTTMTVMWYSPVASCQSVYYGPDPGGCPPVYKWAVQGVESGIAPTVDSTGYPLSPAPTPFAGFYYRAELEGLDAGETYYFRVFDEASGQITREWSFRTMAASQIVRFAFGGDSQRPYVTAAGDLGQLLTRPDAPANWPYMRDFLTQKAADLDPDFVLFLGDLVSRGNNQAQWSHWFDAWQENAVTDSGRMIPIVPVIGNHEMGGYPDIDSSYEWFMGLFAIPQPVAGVPCYSLDFPNLVLTVLAATGGQVNVSGQLAEQEADAQLSWLASSLSSAPASAWRLVAFHCNYLGCFAPCIGYACDEYMAAWTELLQDHGVSAVFMGHTHNYTRSWPVQLEGGDPCDTGIGGLDYQLMTESKDGITYIVSGTWGAVNSPILSGSGCDVRDWIAAAASHPALGFAEVADDVCRFLVENTSGFVIDQFELPYSAPPTFPVPSYVEVIR